MALLYAAIAVAMLASCSTPAKLPDLKPVRASISGASEHVEKARASSQSSQEDIASAISRAEELDKACKQKDEKWQAAYDALRDELNSAYLSAQTTKTELEATKTLLDDASQRAQAEIGRA